MTSFTISTSELKWASEWSIFPVLVKHCKRFALKSSAKKTSLPGCWIFSVHSKQNLIFPIAHTKAICPRPARMKKNSISNISQMSKNMYFGKIFKIISYKKKVQKKSIDQLDIVQNPAVSEIVLKTLNAFVFIDQWFTVFWSVLDSDFTKKTI